LDDLVNFTAKDSGRYRLFVNGTEVSAHNTERELHEVLWPIMLSNPKAEIEYIHDYRVVCVLTNAGATVAGTLGGQVNLPPTISSTPDPSFTEGTEATYDMSQNFFDDGMSTVITSLTNVLPNGLSYDGTTHILDYDGIGPASVSQHQLEVDDQVNPVVTSDPFNIGIVAVPVSIIGAYGYGVGRDGNTIIGGRGLPPIYMSNLDTGGAGSLSAIFGGGTGGHVIPEIGGVIDCIGIANVHKIQVGDGNITLWGNAAPTNLNVHGGGSKFILGDENILIRHIAIRMGDEPGENTSTRNAFVVVDNGGTRKGKNILVENCSAAFTTDQIWSVSSNGGGLNDNINFFRMLGGYPIRESTHPQAPHNLGPLTSHHNRVSYIESLIAGVSGRPRFRTEPFGCMLNCVLYQWDGVHVSLDSQAGSNMKFWIEGCRFIPDDDGTQAPQYNGPTPGGGAATCIQSFDGFAAPEMLYLNDNDYGGIAATGGGIAASALVDRVTALANIQMPEDYAIRIQAQADVSSDANLAATLAGWGSNPTNHDTVDIDLINSVVARTGIWIDDLTDIPSGGYPTIPTMTHIAGPLGQTIQSWLETNVGIPNYNLVAPGFVNMTQIEKALYDFEGGLPI